MGTFLSVIQESWPPVPTWTATDVPDLTGKVIIVTGGNAGIGKETARVLLEHNAKVYIGCRSPERARAAADELKKSTGKTDENLVVLQLDLSDLASIKAAVEDFTSKENRLDVLINSAGVMHPPLSDLTKHGHDAQFGTNVLGHFYLTQLLLPILTASARTSVDGSGKTRVVTVSSLGHLFAPSVGKGGPVIIESLFPGPKRDTLSTHELYHQSKAGNVLVSNAFARKYGDQGVVFTSLNPGNINTELQRHMPEWQLSFIRKIMYSVSFGALTQLYAATAPEAAGYNGKYLGPWARLRPTRPDMEDVAKQEELWAWLEEQVKQHAP